MESTLESRSLDPRRGLSGKGGLPGVTGSDSSSRLAHSVTCLQSVLLNSPVSNHLYMNLLILMSCHKGSSVRGTVTRLLKETRVCLLATQR